MGMFSQLAQGVDWSSMGAMALRIVAVLLCLVVHEVCHGLAAYWLGDPTAKQSHRLSLNPIHHLDPFGLLMMVVVGFGWAKPVPVDPRYFRKPKQGMAITALAGPVSNFLLAYVSAILYSGLYAVLVVRGETTGLALALEFFGVLMTLNIGLGIFNLIPFPPLDGSKVGHVPVGPAIRAVDASGAVWDDCADGRPLVRAAGRLSGDGPLLDAGLDAPGGLLRLHRGALPADVTAMERPVYYIKGVVRDGAEATQDFVGPLDLILHLLQKNRIAVRDIPLAGILAQFLTWMSSRRALDLEVAGEFISMASHLMLLKTRMLLSEQDQEAQSEMEELIASLEARQRHENYARILAVLPQLSEGYQQGRAAFPKGPEPQFARRVYRYVHSGEDLRAAVAAWQARQRRAAPPSLEEFRGVVRPAPYRVEEKAAELLSLLRAEGPRRLTDLIRRSGSRSEATATFLALLELCREGKIHLAGEMDNPEVSWRSGT